MLFSFIFIFIKVNANRVTKTSRDGWKQSEKEQSNSFLKLVVNSMFNREIL